MTRTISLLVSIVIPVYNGSDYLREAIDSALAQTYPNIEIIVVNDGSNDNGATEKIALSYGDKIRYFSKANGGVASALNLAIEKMTGDYFSWLSHDDLYYPNKIESQMRALAEMDRSRTILYGDFASFSDDPAVIQAVHLPGVPPEAFRHFLTIDNSLHGCTLLIPRKAFDECDKFDERLRTTQDYDMWFRLAEKYRFVHLPSVLVKARRHAGQGSVTMRDMAVTECNSLLSGFVESLTKTELETATHRPLSIVYAEIAENLERRGFLFAALRASELSTQNMVPGCLTANLSARITLLRIIVMRNVRRAMGKLKDWTRNR